MVGWLDGWISVSQGFGRGRLRGHGLLQRDALLPKRVQNQERRVNIVIVVIVIVIFNISVCLN